MCTFKYMRLFDVHFLFQNTMKKCVVYIYLSKAPSPGNSNRQNKTDSGSFHNGTEGVLIVNAISLFKTLCNKSSFVAINGSIRFSFYSKYPLAINKVFTLL